MDIHEFEDFFDADVLVQLSNNKQLSDEDSDTEEGTDVQHLSAGQLSTHADFRISFSSYVAGSILTQEEKVHNFDEEECGSKDEPSNSMSFANEKWLSQQIPLRIFQIFQILILKTSRCLCLLFNKMWFL